MCELAKLIRRLGIRRKYILLLLMRSPFDAFRTWMQAYLMKSVFLCLEMEEMGRLLTVCVSGGLLCAMLFLYNGTVWSFFAAFAAAVEARLRREMTEKIMGMPYKRMHDRSSGEWITRLDGDIQAAVNMMNAPLNIPHAATASINAALSCFLLLRGSPALFAITWLFLLPHLLINYLLVLRRVPDLQEESRAAMADVTSSVEPLIAEAESIVLYDAGSLMLEKCGRDSRRLMRTNLRMHLRRGVGDMVFHLLGIGGYLALLTAGLAMIAVGKMAFSDFAYCSQLRGSILGSVLMLITCKSNIRINSVCVKKVNEALTGDSL